MGLADGFRLFCEHLVTNYGDPGGIPEELKAGEFRRYFIRDLPVNVRSLILVAGVCGVNTEAVESGKMPENMRGCHEAIGSRKRIYYREEDTQSGIQNTILHEIREMMEPHLAAVFPGYRRLGTRAAHLAANHFASAVLLPAGDFRESIYRTGFDVELLSLMYAKSWSQVILRMGEVLQGKLSFYGALYEPEDGSSGPWTVRYWSRSSDNTPASAMISRPYVFLPRKGKKAKPGSVVDLAVKTARPHLACYTVCRGGLERLSLVLISQPQSAARLPASRPPGETEPGPGHPRSGKGPEPVPRLNDRIMKFEPENNPALTGQEVTRTAVIALLSQSRELLAPQIKRSKPVIMEPVRHFMP